MIKEESPLMKTLKKSAGAESRFIQPDVQDSRIVFTGGDCSPASGK